MYWEGVGLLHSVTVCHTTSEIFFNLRVHSGDIQYEEHGQMPCVDMSTLSKKVEVMNVAEMGSLDPVVLHRVLGKGTMALVVKY
jgi:hypothetical protein